VGDYDEDGSTNEWDRLQYNDKELSITRFQEWTKVNHPEYGEVEVGGWDGKFYRQNPPPELLEEWAIKEARFNLMLAGSLPQVAMQDPKITKKNGEYTIEVEVENQGFLPTALKQAQLVKIVRPDRISLEFPDDILPPRPERGRYGRMYGGSRGQEAEEQKEAKVEILKPRRNRAYVEIGRIPGNDKATVTFTVKLKDIQQAECTVKYTSTRGGVVSKKILIGK